MVYNRVGRKDHEKCMQRSGKTCLSFLRGCRMLVAGAPGSILLGFRVHG